jgi:hypothetical protein
MNHVNFFLNLIFLSRASAIGVIYEVVTSCAVTQLGSTLSHSLSCGLSHAAQVAPSDMTRLSHISSFDVIGPPRAPNPFFSFFLFYFFFLFLSSPCSGCLVICDFSPLFRARGATNRLYELVFQSC